MKSLTYFPLSSVFSILTFPLPTFPLSLSTPPPFPLLSPIVVPPPLQLFMIRVFGLCDVPFFLSLFSSSLFLPLSVSLRIIIAFSIYFISFPLTEGNLALSPISLAFGRFTRVSKPFERHTLLLA